MTFLSTLLSSTRSSSNAFYLIQSSPAQSALPLLRGLINAQTKCTVVLVCSLYAPSNLLGRNTASTDSKADLKIVDWTDKVPGYGNDNDADDKVNWKSRLKEVQDTFKDSSRAVSVIIDSVDTLEEDIESPSETYKFLQRILSLLNARKDASRLICHISAFSSVLQLLKQPRFAPSLIHLTAHPPALLSYISHAYLASPPASIAGNGSPSSTHSSTITADTLKFWRVFVPLADRPTEVEALVFGSGSADRAESGDGDGRGASQADEFVVEVLVRGRGADLPTISTFPIPGSATGSGGGKQKSVERLLEGWSVSKCAPVLLEELDSLKSLWSKKKNTAVSSEPEEPDPAKGLTFNLNLTESQQASRSQVPLPYERNGSKPNLPEQNQSAHIFYDPDSADDLDDEDPDEDLDL